VSPATAGGEPTRQRRREGQRRRQQIIDATLQVIAREGVRAVRHRAVAAEAGVPLGATTYYFSDIGQLLRDSFTQFAHQRSAAVNEVIRAIAAGLGDIGAAPVDPGRLEALADQAAGVLADYVLGQAGARDDRAIELAFRHEARRDPGLWALIRAQERQFAAGIEALLAQIGSTDPAADAQITLAVIYRLEAEAAFAGLDSGELRRVVSRHVRHLLGLV
jgi:DNA-binding transcriptional regulator YbjK